MNPNAASAQSCRERMRMKKTPMIALKSVNTFPATMLETERLERSSTGPSFRSRFAAADALSPPGCVVFLMEPAMRPFIPKAQAQKAKYRGAPPMNSYGGHATIAP